MLNGANNLFFKYELLGNPFKRLKPLVHLVKDLLLRGTVAVLFSPPSSGKSWVAQSIACSVASGKDWFGKPVTKGAVIYIFSEGQQGSITRLSAWSLVNNVDLTKEPFFITSESCQFEMLAEKDVLHPQSKKIDVVKAADELRESIEHIEAFTGVPTALIVLDVLSQTIGGMEQGHSENAAETINAYMAYLKKLAARPQRTSSIVVHHSGHAATGRPRGSSAIAASADTLLEMKKEGDEFVLSMTKQKDVEISEDKFFKLRKIKVATWKPTEQDKKDYDAMGVDCPEEEEIWSAVLEENQDILSVIVTVDKDHNPISIQDILRQIESTKEVTEKGVTTLVNNWKDFKTFAENLSLSAENGHAALKNCVARGVLEKSGRNYFWTELAANLMSLSGEDLKD